MRIFTHDVGGHWALVLAFAVVLAGAVIAGFILHYVLMFVNRRAKERSPANVLHESLERHCRGPLKLLLPALAFDLAMPALELPHGWTPVLYHLIGIIVIASASWLLITLAAVAADVLLAKYRADESDVARSMTSRRISTQVQVFRRVFLIIVCVLASFVILTTFSWGRTLGESLLASAGIAGIAVGLAARPTLENLVAGIQLALTQPMVIGDAVIVENDWGWIEEITTTYIVVRTWDWRRIVLPLTYFIQKPFQNWSRTSPDLIGTIHFYVDYTAPIDTIRAEFNRIVEASALWDRNVRVLQVTGASEHAIQLRALASARNAGVSWDLRCEIREKLLAFIQSTHPECLPKTRAEFAEMRSKFTENGADESATPPRIVQAT
ncbi:MAG: mechanosensitive ion channel family protein [Candidatus Binataceae bacterium]